jgi:RNA recognition motif-containing protein
MARVKVFKLPFEINSSQLKSVYEPFGVLQAKVAFYTFNGVTKSRGWAILDFPNEASRQEAERRVTRIDNRYVSYTDVTEHDLQMLKGKVGKKTAPTRRYQADCIQCAGRRRR